MLVQVRIALVSHLLVVDVEVGKSSSIKKEEVTN